MSILEFLEVIVEMKCEEKRRNAWWKDYLKTDELVVSKECRKLILACLLELELEYS